MSVEPPLYGADAPDAREVKQRAVGGAVAVFLRGVVVRLLGLAAAVVLARYLSPAELGRAAIAAAITGIGQVLFNGGLNAGLIRRARAPAKRELEAAMGAQLGLAAGFAALATALAIPFGETMELTVVMAAALTLSVLRLPNLVVANRELRFARIARIEVVEWLAFHLVTIAGAVAGLGAWALAIAAVARAVVGTGAMVIWLPPGLLRPRVDWELTRPIVRFGLAFQTITIASSARTHGITFLAGGLGGAAMAGAWSLTARAIQPIALVVQSLSAVGFAAMARLLPLEDNQARLLTRALRLVHVGFGVVAVTFVASAPDGLPLVFGDEWTEVGTVAALMGIALQIGAPSGICVVNYLTASGKAGPVLRYTVLTALAWGAASCALVPLVGIEGIGFGAILSAALDLALLSSAARRHAALSLSRAIAVPWSASLLSSGAGWGVAALLEPTIPGMLAGAAIALALFIVLVALLQRDALVLFGRVMRDRLPTRARRREAAASAGARSEAVERTN